MEPLNDPVEINVREGSEEAERFATYTGILDPGILVPVWSEAFIVAYFIPSWNLYWKGMDKLTRIYIITVDQRVFIVFECFLYPNFSSLQTQRKHKIIQI